VNSFIVCRARAVGSSIVAPEKKSRVTDDLRALRSALPSAATLVVGGAGSDVLRASVGDGVVFVESMAELNAELSMIKARG
jgi:hypothetical protein